MSQEKLNKDLETLSFLEKYDSDDDLNDDKEYEFVNSIAPTTDDPTIPSFTIRVILLGTLWNILLATTNSILHFRTVVFSVSASVAVLLSYPMGIFLAKLLPRQTINLFGLKIDLNPGPFSIKEHVLVYIISAAGGGIAYGIDNVVAGKFKYFMNNPEINFWNSICFVLTVQMIGFGMAGILRRFLVKPMAMYWPSMLPTVAMFIGFHERESKSSQYSISRYKAFWMACGALFLYQWIPEYFMPVLTYISALCLFTSNKMARFLGSSKKSVGLGAFTLNWQVIGGGNMAIPFSTSVQLFVGAIIWTWIITPIMYYSNTFGMDQSLGGGQLLNTVSLFDNKGIPLKAAVLMDTKTFDLNETAYAARGPVYITTMFAIVYGQSFMSIVAALVHVILWYGSTIMKQFKAAVRQEENKDTDIHNRLMRAYPDIPEWMFLTFLGVMILLQIYVSTATPFAMPIWSVFLCLLISTCFLLPVGIIKAAAGVSLGLNVLTEFVIGLMIPGKTVAVMAFKSLGTNSLSMALTLVADLKLGHYLKINPMHMVMAQFYGTFIGAIVDTIVALEAEKFLEHVLFIDERWDVTGYRTFFNAGAIWGAIGPQRFFGVGAIYEGLLWFFLAGGILPFLPWIGHKIYPSKWWALINVPILANSYGNSPGQPQSSIIPSFIVAFVFQYYVFTYHRSWWDQYNYILATAMDIGASLQSLVQSILNQSGIDFIVWSGNPNTIVDYYCFEKTWKK